MDKITEVQKNPSSEHNGKVEEELQLELSEWLFKSEILWMQKSRELWLKEGDRNTMFFHLSTIIRRRNHIDAIKSEEGHWVTSPTQIRQTILSSFKNLYAEEYVSFLEHLDNLMANCITEEDNDLLMKIPSREEIKETLFQMHDLKASGPDGFPALFYKEFWPMVGDAVTNAILSFFTNGCLPREANSSLIVLIPKSANPTTANNFHPIASAMSYIR